MGTIERRFDDIGHANIDSLAESLWNVDEDQLKLELSLTEIYWLLINEALFILVSLGAKTFLVSFFILFITHQLVTRHLTAIAEFVRNIRLGGQSLHEIKLDRPHRVDADELDDVSQALNSMSTKLRGAYVT
ncbi:hypothetical protein JZU71_02195, partial [bacterium]|nr:hypothetical protein [bacterium]